MSLLQLAGCLFGFVAMVPVSVLADAPPTDPDMEAVLVQHNLYRCMHGMPQLQWDNNLAMGAQHWADQGKLHTSDLPVGENLLTGKDVNGLHAAEHWYREIEHTDGGSVQTYKAEAGHYTQMIWNATELIGCGKSIVNDNTFWVCRYSPEGNIPGQFTTNVGPPLKTAKCADPSVVTKNIIWAFGEVESCNEAGTLTVKQRENDLINVMGYGVEEYDLVGFSVSRSAVGLPIGSTDDGQYNVSRSDGEKTRVQVTVVTQELHFVGGSADADGRLQVVSPSGTQLLLGHGHGTAGSACDSRLGFVADQSVISKVQVFGARILVARVVILGLPLHLPVGPAACFAAAMAAAGMLIMAVATARRCVHRSDLAPQRAGRAEYIEFHASMEA